MFYYFVWVGNETCAHWRQLPGSLWAGVCDYDQFWSLAGLNVARAMPNFSFCYKCNAPVPLGSRYSPVHPGPWTGVNRGVPGVEPYATVMDRDDA